MHDRKQLARLRTVERIERAARVAPLVDLQTPRQRGRAAVQLLVEVVPDSADRLRQHDSRRDRVAERGQRNPVATASDPRADAAKGYRAPDAQAAVPDPQRGTQAGAVGSEVSLPVDNDVIEPPAYQTERHRP